jgi:isopenicillin N synthase-like dioxygenase
LRGDETPPDLKELYTIGPFDLPDTPYFTGPAGYPSFAPNRWPVRPVGLRPALEAYWRELDRVARILCRIFAQALDLPPDFFEDTTDRHISHCASCTTRRRKPRRCPGSCGPGHTATSA